MYINVCVKPKTSMEDFKALIKQYKNCYIKVTIKRKMQNFKTTRKFNNENVEFNTAKYLSKCLH